LEVTPGGLVQMIAVQGLLMVYAPEIVHAPVGALPSALSWPLAHAKVTAKLPCVRFSPLAVYAVMSDGCVQMISEQTKLASVPSKSPELSQVRTKPVAEATVS
jgi:hypothetical protein